MISRTQAHNLLEHHIQSPSLRRHSQMVAWATEAYAPEFGGDPEEWYVAGLLHDLDWESHPDEHPNWALANILPEAGATQVQIDAIAAHAPDRTGKQPNTPLERVLFACDELSGFIDAAVKIRPDGYKDLQWSSINKKLKDKRFAANVSRQDVHHGAELLERSLEQHGTFLISVFQQPE